MVGIKVRENESIEEVVVIGSRIPRLKQEGPAPIVTLDATGQCRFAVGEAYYADWEIRRMALEQLFFEESDDDGE